MIRSAAATLSLFLLTTGSCSVPATAPDLLTISATVRFVDVEGGCWRLDAKDGTHYDPVGLPPAFRTDGRRVTATLRFPGNLGSFCMVGRLAEVVAIRDR